MIRSGKINHVSNLPSSLKIMISADKTSELLAIPPLENGDKLTRHEFEQRYHAIPNSPGMNLSNVTMLFLI